MKGVAFKNLSLVIAFVFVLLLIFLFNSIQFIFPTEVISALYGLIAILGFALGYYILFG